MNLRKKIYDTHTVHNKDIIEYIETDDPIGVEMCMRSMLRKYRYKNKKDMYECKRKYITRAFEICKKNINKMKQGGGDIIKYDIDRLIHIISTYDKIISKCDEKLNG